MPTLQITKDNERLEALRSGDLSFAEYIEKLEIQYEAVEPDILALVVEDGRFERIRKEAAELEARYPDPETRPALYGLPVGVKDIFRVDGFDTQAGSKLPADILKGDEAICVSALKQAGAIIFGKTVTTEFAYFAPGPTRNPHNLEHTPGGSSSGSAAAVAAGIVPLALGTQTIGSVTRPASFCGVFGFKPSYDRIPKAGVIPLASSLDHVGLFSADLKIIQAAASVVCQDLGGISTSDIKPILAIPDGPYLQKATPQMLQHFHTTVAKLEAAGYEVKKIMILEDIEGIIERHNTILAVEAVQTHKDWYSSYSEKYHHKTSELIERGQKISQVNYEEALEGILDLRNKITRALHANDVDIWLSPSAPGAAPKGLESTGDPIMNLPWTHSGLPTLNVPSGLDNKQLPLGLQLAADWYQDEKLLGWAEGIAEVVN